MKEDGPLSELMALGEESQVTFLREDIALCHTFADLSKTRFEMGRRESACEARSKAEAAYAAIVRFAPERDQ
jgi:hypothetical protein